MRRGARRSARRARREQRGEAVVVQLHLQLLVEAVDHLLVDAPAQGAVFRVLVGHGSLSRTSAGELAGQGWYRASVNYGCQVDGGRPQPAPGDLADSPARVSSMLHPRMAEDAAGHGRGGRRAGIVVAAAGLVSLAAAGGLYADRASAREQARAGAAVELARFQRCLAGEPLGPGETLGGRLRGVELAVALRGAIREEELDGGTDGGAGDAGGLGEQDASAIPLPAEVWPARCAPFAEALARRIDEAGDPRLDGLREALPSRARFSLPYALMADEAAELAAAVDQAGLPPPAKPPDNEPAPAPIAAPLATAGVTPLGKGRIGFTDDRGSFARGVSTDLLATSTVHVLLLDARPRVCAFPADGPAGPLGVARCGQLPEWMSNPSLPVLDDGAPLAVNARKATHGGAREWLEGIVVFTPGGMKAIPINAERNSSSDFLADGN